MRDSKLFILNPVMNKMEVHDNMFHSRVEDQIGTKIHGTDIVTIMDGLFELGDAKFVKQRLNLYEFRSS